MKRIATLLAATVSLAVAQPVLSQNKFLNSQESLGLVHNASIEVFDDVSGGCWTNAEAIKQKARLTLEQSGIDVYLEPLSENYPYSASIYIEAFGERSATSACYGAIEVFVGDTSSRVIGDTYLMGGITFFQNRSVAIGPSLNEQFSQMVEESINELAADILSGRRNEQVERLINQHEEKLTAEPETFEEWKKRFGVSDPQ